ncbi:MAG: cell division protein SepF [Candidatus Altiarchaeota archaeon]|nr:cell division protein SepF [Candidatus Altiarchaeota archaeon]
MAEEFTTSDIMIGGLLKAGKVKKVEDIVEAQMIHDVKKKIKLGLLVMERYTDVEKVLSRFRKSDSILIVKISPLRDKDMSDLKKAIDRIKTHCSVTGAELAALDDNWIVLVPPVVEVLR